MTNGQTTTGPVKVLLVYPRFNGGSFWNYRAACEVVGAKYPAPPLGLITVAAMLPDTWDIRLIDCNAETLEDQHIDWADMVMTGGMLNQQWETLQIIERCKARGTVSVVGGPDVTSSPQFYASADFKVIGEAEGVIGAFIAAWENGERQGSFTAEKFTADVTTSPLPRFDLLNLKNYTQVGVQFSRGCPFVCEFCDIIELYGRRPRMKTNAQMMREIQTLYDSGYRGAVDFVDDNLIGNKKAVKAFLTELLPWQKERGFPFAFSTEASINLADDDELLQLLSGCGFYGLFVGIESPDPEILAATRKKQNTRRDIVASIQKIYDAGIYVTAGFIVGFDGEKKGVDEEIVKLIEEAAIPVAMVGLLYALPNTQLTRRLTSEGRLHAMHDEDVGKGEDQCINGLNFDTLRPRHEILSDYRAIVARIYDPEVYGARVLRMVKRLKLADMPIFTASLPGELLQAARMAWNITRQYPQERGIFWRTLAQCVRLGPATIRPAMQMLAIYLHLGPYSRYIIQEIDAQLVELQRQPAAAGTQPTEPLAVAVSA